MAFHGSLLLLLATSVTQLLANPSQSDFSGSIGSLSNGARIPFPSDSVGPQIFTARLHGKQSGQVQSSATNVEISTRSVSDGERLEGIGTLNRLRRSVAATNMMHACWETVLADYAQSMTADCSVNAGWPDDFNSSTYSSNNIMTAYLWSMNSYTVSYMLEYMYGQSQTSYYKMVMQHDLVAIGCGESHCHSFETASGALAHQNVDLCLFYYRSNFTSSGSAYTPGTACSSCPAGSFCDSSLCRGNSSYLPSMDCESPSSASTAMLPLLTLLMISLVVYIFATHVST